MFLTADDNGFVYSKKDTEKQNPVGNLYKDFINRYLTILVDENKWCKNEICLAANGTVFSSKGARKKGKSVEPHEKEAVSFCLMGTGLKISHDLINQYGDRYKNNISCVCSDIERIMSELTDSYFGPTLFNDRPETTFDDIVNLINTVNSQIQDYFGQ